jgi:hypothetical protein
MYNLISLPQAVNSSYFILLVVSVNKTCVVVYYHIVRRIYGPVRQGREWRIRNNEEIDNIIRKKDMVRFVKARRISWVGHVERMEENRMPKRVIREKIYTRRKKG